MALLGEHNGIIRRCIAEHHGFEVKTEGDAFMIAFQSARDALRCAIAVQRAFADAGGKLRAADADGVGFERRTEGRTGTDSKGGDRPLRVRMGLHTGEPVKDGDDFYGTYVVMAARIASMAAGGEILVSALLRELVAASGEFELEARAAVELKGLGGEHVTYGVGW